MTGTKKTPDTPPDPRFLIVGQVIRPHGVRGELRVRIMTSYPERFKQLDQVALGNDPQDSNATFYEVERARIHQGYGIVKLVDVDDRSDAEGLRDLYLMVALDDAVPLEEGEFYVYQLIGLSMVTDSGDYLGEVSDIIETGANDVYVVQGPLYGELLIPAIASVIHHIDLEARQITITPIPGLLPDHS